MLYAKDFVFLNAQSGAESAIYYNEPKCVEEIDIQISGTISHVKVQGRNGADESWVDITCMGMTANGLKVTADITEAGLWTPLMLPRQIRLYNSGTVGVVNAYAQIKGV